MQRIIKLSNKQINLFNKSIILKMRYQAHMNYILIVIINDDKEIDTFIETYSENPLVLHN